MKPIILPFRRGSLSWTPFLAGMLLCGCQPNPPVIHKIAVEGEYRNFALLAEPGIKVQIRGEHLKGAVVSFRDANDRRYEPTPIQITDGQILLYAPDDVALEGPVDIEVETEEGRDVCRNCFTYLAEDSANALEGLLTLPGYDLPPDFRIQNGFDSVDLDGDGRKDIVAAEASWGIRFYLRREDEGESARFLTITHDDPSALEWTADVAAFRATLGGRTSVFLFTANRRFEESPEANAANRLLEIEWDPDCTAPLRFGDCVVAEQNLDEQTTTSFVHRSNAVDQRDLNGDHLPDFAVANGLVTEEKQEPEPNVLYLSRVTENGLEYEARLLDRGAGHPSSSIRFLDLVHEEPENLGYVDLVSVDYEAPGTPCLRIYRGDGGGGFTEVDVSTLFEEVPTGQCMDLQGGDLLPPADGENPPDLFLLRNNWNTQGESQENLLYVFDPEQGRYLLRSDALPRDSELGIPDDDGNLIPNTHAGFLRRFKAILTDLNADGATDIAVAGERVSFYLNEGERMRFFPLVDTFDTDGSETLPHQFLRARVFSTLALHPIDLDGDPFPDLIAGNRGEQNRLLSNRGNLGGDPASWGGFADVTIDPAVFWPSGEMSLDASFADLDGNGATDVLFVVNGQTGEDSPGVDYAFRNAFYVSPNEDGRFRVLPDRDAEGTPLWPYEDGENSRGVTWADFNGDGFLDLAVANWGKNRAYFFDHFGTQGDPTFIDRSAFLFGGDEVNDRNSYDLAAGDLDGDRDPDLVVANLLAPAEVFLNDGSSWRRQELPETENLFVYGVALGDVNLDGSLDIVLATGGRVEPVRVGAKDLLFLNDGNGGFASPLPLGEEESVGKDVVVTDLNGDGFPEVVIANSGKETGGGTNLLYLNRGGDGEGMWLGLEPRAESLPGLPNHTEAVAAGDLDGDGDVDLVFSIVDTTGDFKRYGFGYATKVLINFCGGGCASPDFGDLTPLVLKIPLENVPWASLPLSPSAVPAMDEHVVYGLSLGYVRVGGVERPILVAAEDGQTRILLHREIPIP